MLGGIEVFYERIGESIIGAIVDPWTSAWMEAVFFADHTDFYGEFISRPGADPQSYLTGRDGRRAFEELREGFKNAGKPLWCRARFELDSDGNFKMDWGYDGSDPEGFAHYDPDEDLEKSKELRNRKFSGG